MKRFLVEVYVHDEWYDQRRATLFYGLYARNEKSAQNKAIKKVIRDGYTIYGCTYHYAEDGYEYQINTWLEKAKSDFVELEKVLANTGLLEDVYKVESKKEDIVNYGKMLKALSCCIE